jgi:hypothetical protein
LNPLAFLLILVALTCVVAAVTSWRRSRRHVLLRGIATQAKYNFSLLDRFHLATRVQQAAGSWRGAPVRVARDVMYRTLGTSVDPHRHFVFVVEIEPVAGERRITRTVSALEEAGVDSGLKLLAEHDADDAEAFRSLVRPSSG